MQDKGTVCAIVVTYNRKELLIDCLDSLREQTRPLDAIYIIDNASSDGTETILRKNKYIEDLPPISLLNPWEKEFYINNLTDKTSIRIHYVRMPENTGGAGGFHEGLKRGYEKRYDWLWLMDDDVILDKDALSTFFDVQIEQNEFGFFCSNVLGENNLPINVPGIDFRLNENRYVDWGRFMDRGLIKVRACTFVSVFLNRKIVENIGLPFKDFFIWEDDHEYTLRISSKFPSYQVAKSIVYHLREIQKYLNINLEKDKTRIKLYYYKFRNSLYILRKYDKKRKVAYIFYGRFILVLKSIFTKHGLFKTCIILKGSIHGLFFKPKS
jgi:GT2 family glycosyltransferase